MSACTDGTCGLCEDYGCLICKNCHPVPKVGLSSSARYARLRVFRTANQSKATSHNQCKSELPVCDDNTRTSSEPPRDLRK